MGYGAPLIPYFRELTDAPVVLGNDANVIALAEWRAGAGRGFDDVLAIKVSTGLGAGIISGGALQCGRHGSRRRIRPQQDLRGRRPRLPMW